MSAEQLSRLSLGGKGENMVTTRASAARALVAPAQDTETSPPDNPGESPTPFLIQASDGRTYDVSTFDEDLRRRAELGLSRSSKIKLNSCQELLDQSNQYVFHLDDDITVDVYSDRAPQCSCGANEGGRACRHIFWILSKVTSMNPDVEVPGSQPLQLAKDGSSVQETPVAATIEKLEFDDLVHGLDGVLQSPEDESRIHKEMANMLSVFEPTEDLASRFLIDEALQKYQEFKNLLLWYAERDSAFYLRLKPIIPLEYQTKMFFHKLIGRIDRAFQALEEHKLNGTTNDRAEALDVPGCAARLQDIVDTVINYYDEHEDDADIASRAASVLVKVFDQVARSNINVYENITWGPMPKMKPSESNLFYRLVVCRSEDHDLFVLHALQKLPEAAVRHWSVDLEYIRALLEEATHTIALLEGEENEEEAEQESDTLAPYIDALQDLIHENRKRAASQSGGSRAKRPMQSI